MRGPPPHRIHLPGAAVPEFVSALGFWHMLFPLPGIFFPSGLHRAVSGSLSLSLYVRQLKGHLRELPRPRSHIAPQNSPAFPGLAALTACTTT